VTRFVDFWSNLEEQNTRLRAAFYAALIVAGIEAWGLMRIALAPAPVYVVPGATTSGLYRADETWQVAARHFAESYVMTVANFTPETAQRSFQTALQYLSPAALSLARTQLDEELARMKRDRISSQCVPEGEAEIAYQQDGSLTAVVRGQRRIYAGRELISEKPITYRLTIGAVVRSRTYPQGLQIQSVEQEPASDSTGKGGNP